MVRIRPAGRSRTVIKPGHRSQRYNSHKSAVSTEPSKASHFMRPGLAHERHHADHGPFVWPFVMTGEHCRSTLRSSRTADPSHVSRDMIIGAAVRAMDRTSSHATKVVVANDSKNL